MPSVARRPAIDRDVEDIAVHIGKHSQGAAARFLDAVEQTFGALAVMPGLGGIYPLAISSLQGLRHFGVRGFQKVVVFYLPRENGIEVVRVLHGARDLAAILEAEI